MADGKYSWIIVKHIFIVGWYFHVKDLYDIFTTRTEREGSFNTLAQGTSAPTVSANQ